MNPSPNCPPFWQPTDTATINDMDQHPITPPPELLSKWEDEILKRYENVDVQLLNAYQAGADAELEACCEWLRDHYYVNGAVSLLQARRPEPPSLKEQASESLDKVVECLKVLVPGAPVDGVHIETIRRALEALPDD